jgi:LPXTG-motif cell wall-anchored protein
MTYDTLMQAALWIGAGFLLILLMGRRRKRKAER